MANFCSMQVYRITILLKYLPKTAYNVTSLLKTDWIMSINSKLSLTNSFNMQISLLVSVMQSEPVWNRVIADVHI